MTVLDRIEQLCKENSTTTEELAESLETTKVNISDISIDGVTEFIVEVAKRFKVNPLWLLGVEPTR